MKIVFLTLLSIENLDERNIYTDLAMELINLGNKVTIVSPYEKREGKRTQFLNFEDYSILKVKIGDVTQTRSKIHKGISTLTLDFLFKKAIKEYLRHESYDVIIYSTPPITLNNTIQYLKSKNNAITYLMLKDIFPQNAVDLEMISRSGLIHKLFRRKEKKLYEISDHIGCMSQANIEYLYKHNDFIDRAKLEVFPNCILIEEKPKKDNHNFIRSKYGIPVESTIFLYGGNIGIPQGVDFIINVVNNFDRVLNGFLLIIGSGTEQKKLSEAIDRSRFKNVLFLEKMLKPDYEEIVSISNVGLIFLDRRFTIPNFPSRLLTYMEFKMPVIACTDIATDIGSILESSNSGFWIESGDLDLFIAKANLLSSNNQILMEMGNNSYNYLTENYDVKKNVNKIVSKYQY